jgi:predicted nucleotidyltransferase
MLFVTFRPFSWKLQNNFLSLPTYEDKGLLIMRTLQEYLDIIKAHQPELQERFGITSMRLFGSVARSEHHEGSDIDLFVTMPPKLYNHILAAQYLEELLGCSVDLIQEHKNLRPFFRNQIEQDGIDVFTAA